MANQTALGHHGQLVSYKMVSAWKGKRTGIEIALMATAKEVKVLRATTH